MAMAILCGADPRLRRSRAQTAAILPARAGTQREFLVD